MIILMLNKNDDLIAGSIITVINNLRTQNGIKNSQEIFVDIPFQLDDIQPTLESTSAMARIIKECNIYSGSLADGLSSSRADDDIFVNCYPF